MNMIYAISDVHGDKEQATKLLREEGVINDENHWNANTSVLVVNGDSVDRGPNSFDTLQFFYTLTQEAEQAGGKVIHTMGNHDALMLCMVLQCLDDFYDATAQVLFIQNGGSFEEVEKLANNQELIQYVQSFPLMCRVNDVLFQHADGFGIYESTARYKQNPDEKIKAVNKFAKTQAEKAIGAWQMFYELTDERRWGYQPSLMPKYLQMFGAKMLVHGHTPHKDNAPAFYMDNTVVNIDSAMSIGYRNDETRGCVLTLDKPATNIVI